jgi:hypothetical protein
MPRPFSILFANLGIWIQGLGAAGHVSSIAYFLNSLEEEDQNIQD